MAVELDFRATTDGEKPFGLYPMNLHKRLMFSYSYVSENIASAAALFS